ncbi:Gfo/Idh/MocA family protein [Sphingobium xenophagum]|uniref:Gfo/Idh/MocA family protein n=1 Tax=Sphingobium xenophagum TaxID=121428 RepID=UPI0003800936|nr:Gfo/Idh/MocA family oxidoreductase [Sphingobium xenophagum]
MANAPIGLGVVGLGRGFMLSLPTLVRHTGFRLAAAFDPREDAREAFANRFGGPAYADLDALLDDPQVEAVYIASPHGVHAAQAIAAAAAGKHVLVEKPMAISGAECRAMTDAAMQAGIVLVVGPSHGFDAQVARACEIIASGVHGAPKMATALNYTDFLYRFRRPEELVSASGGGVVYSQAAHQFDILCRLMQGPVRSIRAQTGIWDPARPSEGAYTALASFDGGAAATLTYSGYGRYDSDELVDWVSELGFARDPHGYGAARRNLRGLDGSDEATAKASRGYGAVSGAETANMPQHHEHFGFVLVSCEQADLRLTPRGVWIYANEKRTFEPLGPPDIPRSGAFDEFAAAIRGDRPARHDGAWGTHLLACCEALLRSSAEQREIAI